MNVTEANKILKENGIQGELIWSTDYADRQYAEHIKKEEHHMKHLRRKNK